MNNIKKLFLLTGLLLCTIASAFAQNDFEVSGLVKDENGEPLPGVNLVVKNQPGFGVITDGNGQFKIKTAANDILIVSFIGFETKQEPIDGKKIHNIVLINSDKALNEVTVTVGAGVQRKVSIVGAITSVDVSQLKIPTSNLSNALAGNVAGIIARQRSGEPGQNSSEFWIRGISTFGANSAALVLVDGIERNFNEVNVEDIESFSVLKDASATAIYGSRGANGVVIITTKTGKEGKVNINFKAEAGNSSPSRMPEYVDAVDYASLANEARMSRFEDPLYSESDMDIIQYGLDSDIYPNVNWYDELLKKSTNNGRGTISISGGGSNARYFISGAYFNEEGMYKESTMNNYSTNANYKRYNFRSNVDVNITKTTKLNLGVSGWIVDQNKPGAISDYIWQSLAFLPNNTVPIKYSNGLFPTYGTGNTTNPFVLLTQTGYKTMWENKLETNVGLNQDLSFITKGLTLNARFSYDAYSYHEVGRIKLPDLYKAEKQRDGKGNLVMIRIANSSPLSQYTTSWGDRRYYSELTLNYDREIAKKHRVGGMLLYYAQDYSKNNAGNDVFAAIPKRNLAFSGRATYSYDSKYFLEGNFGYTGSENFEAGKRFGFFPAVAGGWMISNESFIQDNVPAISNLKVRYSWGEVGNDVLPYNKRFPYISTVSGNGGYNFGDAGKQNVGGIGIGTIGTPSLTWEIARKKNLGFDLGLFNKFNATIDFFQDNRSNIFMQRGNIPATTGLQGSGQIPWANVGKMVNRGMDGTAAYNSKIGKVNFTLRGNITYARTEVLDYDEAVNDEFYQMTRGYRWHQTRGLVALGLFENKEDIANSPRQTFTTDVLPGDIKYKDVNGDGLINDKDFVPIGSSSDPGLQYGFGMSAQWNGFDFNVLLQGTGQCDLTTAGYSVFPFAGGDVGNVLKAVTKVNDRWISREISGSASTENVNATFPRLTYGWNSNNYQSSSYWIKNGRYLRLKNLELGYTIPKQLTRMLTIENMRVYLMGTNLLVWDDLKWWDPELGSGNGNVYPISKTLTAGVTVSF